MRYSEIAKYFFKYYWLQECKSKLRQGPVNQPPEITAIIRKEFAGIVTKDTFKKLESEEPTRIERCVKQIAKKGFDDVIPRFQNEKRKFFFNYLAKEYRDSANNKKIDPGGGILLNSDAVRFFKANYVPLYKAVILEWVRFLEIRNFGTPRLVQKIEAEDIGPRDQAKFRKSLESFTDNICFYCKESLESDTTQVDHVLPFDYIGDTELWNLVLACQKCNCEKLNYLPPQKYLTKLHERNTKNQNHLENSLHNLNYGAHDIDWHYVNAKQQGYHILESFPNKRRQDRQPE